MEIVTYRVRFLMFTVVLMVSPLSPASAEEPAADLDTMRESSARFAEARRHLDDGDHDGAIKLLDQALAALPEEPGYGPTRTQMLLLIVEAHDLGFAKDGDLERLQVARRLLDRYLGPLDLLDEQGRVDAEERRIRLIDQIARIEVSRRRGDAERAAAERQARAEKTQKQARLLTNVGAAATALGAAGLGVMATGLGLGSRAESAIDKKATEYAELPACAPGSAECQRRLDELSPLRRQGNSGNIMTVVGATVGGALLITGVTLLLVGRQKRRQAKSFELTPSPAVSRSSIGIAFVGRF